MSPLRRRWRFTGTVQGVGFRYYARAAALHLGLTGWVANNWDGSVTLEAQGDRAALDALVPLIERTNRWARKRLFQGSRNRTTARGEESV